MLDCEFGVIDGSSGKEFERTYCVLEVGDLLRLRSFVEISALGPKADKCSVTMLDPRKSFDKDCYLRCLSIGGLVCNL